ncbi:hypothetical protein JW988_09005 [Candidatus Bathyarchaeota archaeon]|nr:hypothetical protein [Candidatus Bathyarchaeota archaeon]
MLIASQLSPLALANNPVTSEALTFTVYLDGYVWVNHELEINQTFPSINATLLGETRDEIIIVDEQNLPVDYKITSDEAFINSLGASQIKISYFTPDLTSKTGKYWTLKTEVSTNTTVKLPEDSSIISLNNVPEFIESSNGQVTLVMPPGNIEISYIPEHGLYNQSQNIETWQLIAITSFPTIASLAFVIWFVRRKKTPSQPKEHVDEVDVDKLFEKEKHLRPEEAQVIRFLAEKHGTAFEAELYEKLNLPRTTTWRLLKRLEKMEIVNIKKSRRQNIVSVRKKYMKS